MEQRKKGLSLDSLNLGDKVEIIEERKGDSIIIFKVKISVD